MKFTKMHGLGNDYVFVDCSCERVDDAARIAGVISDRRTGVGSDGLILILPSDAADLRIEVYNADGSRAQMCGNGIRCVAKYAVERGFVGAPATPGDGDHAGPSVRIETDAGVKLCRCHVHDGVVRSVCVDMGRPSLAASAIPSTIPVDPIIEYTLRLAPSTPRGLASQPRALASEPRALARAASRTSRHMTPLGTPFPVAEHRITCVSIGNPHAIVFVDDLDAIVLDETGPRIERAPQFPERINAHFVRVDSSDHVTVKSWERGSGATQACGTGACAVCVAGVITHRTRRKITATLPGGDLAVEWAENDHLYLTGPAIEVFTGDWPG